MPINPLRGEAKLTLAGNQYVLAITMESLAQLSLMLGDPPFEELYGKLMRGSLAAMRAGLGLFVQSGTTSEGKALNRRDATFAALRDISLSDLGAWVETLLPLLEAVTRKASDPEGESGNRSAAQA